MHPAKLLGHPANSEWAIMPICEGYFRKTLFSEVFRKTLFSENFRKKKVDFRKNSRKRSGRSVFRKFSEKRVFRNTSFFFRKKVVPEVILFGFFKMLYFSNYLILINKLSYKINNIIIHKLLLVNKIMTNICNSFFTRM